MYVAASGARAGGCIAGTLGFMVSVRYTLVIGAQCAALGKLSSLPRLANEIHETLTDPLLGHCEATLPDVSGPLLDPTVEAMRDHLEEAFRRASEARASLFVAFIGHGRVAVDGPGRAGWVRRLLPPPFRLSQPRTARTGHGMAGR